MTPSRILIAVLVCLSAMAQPARGQAPAPESSRAIADTVGRLFAAIPTITNALDLEALIDLYRPSDHLTYVANGRVVRSFAAMRDLVHAQFDRLTAADLRWLETHVDVPAQDVAIATASFAFTATLDTGATATSSGTYTAIYVRRDGEWKIEYSAHTFPRTGP
jgi:uncharacterized protein (TIGR02246 family)